MFDRSADTDSSIDTDALLCINMDENNVAELKTVVDPS